MKKIRLILLASILVNSVRSQDIITKNDSSKTKAVIMEINPTAVKYKLFNYNEGPTITVNKEDLAYITFRNGVVEKFAKTPAKQINNDSYNPNRYNLDVVPVTIYTPEAKAKKCEKLYTRKNYIGFNYITFLNSALGFNYMRDIKKANLIVNVPFAFGLGSPSITNSLYKGNYLNGYNGSTYDLLKYQVGLTILFAPSMTREVNFLMGPSFNYSAYKVTAETRYVVPTIDPNKNESKVFKNSFELRREHYGINIGFLARFSERINMNMLITFGYKKDTYSEKDPFGTDAINTVARYPIYQPDNVMPYVNFAWSVGYRF